MKKIILGILTVLGFAGYSAIASAAPKTVSANWSADYWVTDSKVSFLGCTNTGSTISFSGNATVLANIQGLITVSNNLKWTKSYQLLGNGVVTLAVAAGQEPINKQGGINNGVGGNPWISWQYDDSSDRVWLGRCVQGTSNNINRNGNFLNGLRWTVGTSECSPSKSAVNSSSVNKPSGINGTIYLQNSLNNPQQTGDVSGSLVASIVGIDPTNRLNVTSKNANSLAGGNPHIYVRLLKQKYKSDGSADGWAVIPMPGSDAQGDVYLGRCRDLLP